MECEDDWRKTMNQSLQVQFCGIQLENPCLLSSASPTQSKEGIAKAFKLGWAGAVTKTCIPDELITPDAPNRFAVLRNKDREIMGFENLEGMTQKPVAYWEQAIHELKKEFPSKVVVASMMANANLEAWRNLARRLEHAGADAVELNLSCPHFRLADQMGAAVGKDEEKAAAIVACVKKELKIPVLAKLTPNVSSIQDVAAAVVKAGADGIVAINTVQALLGVDIDTLEPLPAVNGYSAFGGYSGISVKPISLRCVAQIAQIADVPIHGVGGITAWQDVIEYMAVGASCVQVCTAVMLNGYSIITPLLRGLEEYVQKKGLHSLQEIIGAAIPKLIAREQLNMNWDVRSTVVAPEDCVQCAKCMVACQESGKAAINFVDQKVTVDLQRCDGCSLCTHVCPCGVLALR